MNPLKDIAQSTQTYEDQYKIPCLFDSLILWGNLIFDDGKNFLDIRKCRIFFRYYKMIDDQLVLFASNDEVVSRFNLAFQDLKQY